MKVDDRISFEFLVRIPSCDHKGSFTFVIAPIYYTCSECPRIYPDYQDIINHHYEGEAQYNQNNMDPFNKSTNNNDLELR